MQSSDIILGFLLGFFANWAFAIALRSLPDDWVRYRIQIDQLQEREDPSSPQWWARVKIVSPRWLKRVFLKEPLKEYLGVELKLDGGKCIRTKWEGGDVNHSLFRADGAGMFNALAFTVSHPNVYLTDNITGAENVIQEGKHTVRARIIRLVDGDVAAEKQFPFVVAKGRVSIESG